MGTCFPRVGGVCHGHFGATFADKSSHRCSQSVAPIVSYHILSPGNLNSVHKVSLLAMTCHMPSHWTNQHIQTSLSKSSHHMTHATSLCIKTQAFAEQIISSSLGSRVTTTIQQHFIYLHAGYAHSPGICNLLSICFCRMAYRLFCNSRLHLHSGLFSIGLLPWFRFRQSTMVLTVLFCMYLCGRI